MPMKASDLSENPYPSILIVGDSGTRKTRFIGTCPKPYSIDTDRGSVSLRDSDAEYDPVSDGPYDKRANGTKGNDPSKGVYPWGTGWEVAQKLLNKVGEQFDKGERPYETCALDSLTTLSDLAMNYVLKADNREMTGIRIQDWGSQIQLLQKFISDFMSFPCIKVVTAHIQRNQNDLTQVTEMLPLVTGKLAGKISLYFDEVYFTKTVTVGEGANKKQVTQFTTTATPLIKQAKSRWGVPDGTEATWKAIEPYLRGTKK